MTFRFDCFLVVHSLISMINEVAAFDLKPQLCDIEFKNIGEYLFKWKPTPYELRILETMEIFIASDNI